jgi:AcrR family transcriptional regulator
MTTVDEPTSPAARRRGAYAKSEHTKEAILQAALDVFAESGFRGGSLRDVAKRAGMTQPALFHHFPSKSDLLEAVLVRRDQQSYQLAPLDRMDGEASIRGLVELVRYNASTPGVVDLYATLSAEATSPDHPVHDYFVRRSQTVRTILTRAFQQLEDEGKLADGVTPAWAADTTMSLMDGLQVQWLLSSGSLDMAERLSTFLRLITRLEL